MGCKRGTLMSARESEHEAHNAVDGEGSAAPSLSFDINRSTSHLLHRAQQVAADLHLEAFGAKGLTQRQLAVLATLSGTGAVSQTKLVAHTGIDRSTMAEMITRLVTKGLVSRAKSSSDSRANDVQLTDEGKTIVAAALPRLAQLDQAILSLVNAGKRDALIDLLRKLALPESAQSLTPTISNAKKSKKKEKKKKEKKKKL
jgi:MarR family transcriptional regulator, temperature-dependent positive regulator of motility